MAPVSSAAEADSNIRNALRVSQLDASELDSQLFELIKSQLNSIFKYFKPHFLVKYSPEIHALIRLLIWKYSVHASEATIGQQLLDLKYMNTRTDASSTSVWMSNRQKLLYALLTVGIPWLDDRKTQLKSRTSSWPHADKFWRFIEWLSKAVRILSLINFLVFLTRGQYQLLTERLLGITTVFPRPVGARQIGFEYMDRELLWHGFAEFLFFVLPLINFRRIKNFISRHLTLKSIQSQSTQIRSRDDLIECAVCGLWPHNPHEIGCRHVFCYYCIQSNFLADPSFTCPICGQAVKSDENVVPVSMTTAS